MMLLGAQIGATALWLLYLWLASAIVCQYLSERKGYGMRPGLAAGLLLTVAGVVLWLLIPARADSRWKIQGPLPIGERAKKTVAEARAEMHAERDE